MRIIKEVKNMMLQIPTSETSIKDPVKVHIGRDKLNPPMKGVTREFHPNMRKAH